MLKISVGRAWQDLFPFIGADLVFYSFTMKQGSLFYIVFSFPKVMIVMLQEKKQLTIPLRSMQ